MLDLDDIPTVWYLRSFVWGIRFLRRIGVRGPVRSIRERAALGIIGRLHLLSIHQIRNFSLGRYLSGGLYELASFAPLEELANAHRNVFSDFLEVAPEGLHCTIKVCCGGGPDKADIKVCTIARSIPCHRPPEYGPDVYHLVGQNSSFAPLVGCNDRKNIWIPQAFSCFACNNLIKHSGQYDCSREDWMNYYKSTIVFPLRYRIGAKSKVMGFLTIDSDRVNVFGAIPDIFDHKDNSSVYAEKLSFAGAFHIGGILADTLATTFYLEESLGGGIQ